MRGITDGPTVKADKTSRRATIVPDPLGIGAGDPDFYAYVGDEDLLLSH